MVGVTGIEPVTPSMSTKCSPTELYAQHFYFTTYFFWLKVCKLIFVRISINVFEVRFKGFINYVSYAAFNGKEL